MAETEIERSAFERTVIDTMNWAYDRAVNGFFEGDKAEDIAKQYLKSNRGHAENAIDNMIGWQILKAGTAGFVTNIGGIITIPIALPANIATVMYIQLRMIAAIAHLRGHDLNSDQVKTFCLAALTGSGAVDLIKGAGVQIGTKLTTNIVKSIPGQAIISINKAVGFRMITIFGKTGAINIWKVIPIVGGVIGGSVDALTTRATANAAKSLFPSIDEIIIIANTV